MLHLRSLGQYDPMVVVSNFLILFRKRTLVFYCWLVFIDHMVNQQRACGTQKQVGPFFLLQCHSKLSVASLVCYILTTSPIDGREEQMTN